MQLTTAYEIQLPTDHAIFASQMKIVREVISALAKGTLASLAAVARVVAKNYAELRHLYKTLIQLDMSEQLIMVAPFLTTIDSSLLNFTANPEPVPPFCLHLRPLEVFEVSLLFVTCH